MAQITIREVACEAGVSTATAADILRPDTQRSYRAETVTRILETAQRLGYEANGAARMLRQKTTNLVGLAINTATSYLNPMVGAADTALRERGYVPVFLEIGQPSLQSSFFNLNMLAGVISADAKMMSEIPEVYEELHRKLPVIALYPMKSKKIDCVTTDRVRLIEMAVEHLVELGHRRIAFADINPTTAPTDALKLDGWKRALTRFPVDRDLRYLISLTPHTDHVKHIIHSLLSMAPAPTALVCCEDFAVHVMRQLQIAGWKIPNELSIVVHGRRGYGSFTLPSLTTVLPPLEEVGRVAAERLVQRIEAAKQAKNLRPWQQFIEPTLVVRESTVSVN